MGKGTTIEWCDDTANPTMGCDGCELWEPGEGGRRSCYAGVLHERKAGQKGFAPRFTEVTEFPGRMLETAGWSDLTGKAREGKPWLSGLPRVIFVSDMSDSLSAGVTFEFLEAEVIRNVASEKGRRHQWLWLTKRPQRMADFSGWLKRRGQGWPGNLWPGTSLTAQATAARIDPLVNSRQQGNHPVHQRRTSD